MATYKLTVEVDIDKLKESSEEEDVEAGISKEMGWVQSSGITLSYVTEVKESE